MEPRHHKSFDLIVVGGGAAGIAAAQASAAIGKRVALIEAAPYLGGKATAAYVGTICGSYFRSEKEIGKMVAGGFLASFVNSLAERSKTKVQVEKEGIQFLPYDQFQFQRLSEELCKDKNIEVFLQSTVFAAEQKNQHITSVTAMVGSDRVQFNTATVVDCSGNAVMADLLDLNTIASDKYQAAAKVFGLAGLDKDLDLASLKLSLYKGIKKGVMDQDLDTRLQHVSVVPASYKNGCIFLKIGLPTVIDGRLNQLTPLNIEGRRLIEQITGYLTNMVSYFKNCTLASVPSEVGIRTGKRHLGKTVLTKDWVLAATKHPQSIARGSWPIEKWDYGYKPEMEYFAEAEYYDITAEILSSNQVHNLYFGGRNISADDGAIASARVIGTCLQTGYAAGLLASRPEEDLSATIKEIQTKLEIIS